MPMSLGGQKIYRMSAPAIVARRERISAGLTCPSKTQPLSPVFGSKTSTQRPSRDATCNRVASSWTFRTGLVLEGPLRMLTASMTSTHSLSSSDATVRGSPLEAGANSVSCAGARVTPANSEVGNSPAFAAASGSEIDRCSGFKLEVKSGELKAVLAREKASAQTPQAAKLMRPEAIPYRALLLMSNLPRLETHKFWKVFRL